MSADFMTRRREQLAEDVRTGVYAIPEERLIAMTAKTCDLALANPGDLVLQVIRDLTVQRLLDLEAADRSAK